MGRIRGSGGGVRDGIGREKKISLFRSLKDQFHLKGHFSLDSGRVLGYISHSGEVGAPEMPVPFSVGGRERRDDSGQERPVREHLGGFAGGSLRAGLCRCRGDRDPVSPCRRRGQARSDLPARHRRPRGGLCPQPRGARAPFRHLRDRHAGPRLHRQARLRLRDPALYRSSGGLPRRGRHRQGFALRRIAGRLGGGRLRRRPTPTGSTGWCSTPPGPTW